MFALVGEPMGDARQAIGQFVTGFSGMYMLLISLAIVNGITARFTGVSVQSRITETVGNLGA